MNTVELKEITSQVEALLGGENFLELDITDTRVTPLMPSLHKARVRIHLAQAAHINVPIKLSKNKISFQRMSVGNKVSTPAPTPVETSTPVSVEKRATHSYRPPKLVKDVQDILLDKASHVVWFKGPTGAGKTVAAQHIARSLGMKMFQINCHYGMGPESLVGERTVEIDQASGQNFVRYAEGVVVQAMRAGLDDDGNEVGVPGLLFIDEAGAMPTQVAIVLNRLLESDDPRRTITLEHDGGRIVRSHSKFRIILSANTSGRGANSMTEAMYTAQVDALDISLLNRVAATFRFGYDREVEKAILMEKIGDDRVVSQLLRFRDSIRDCIKAGKLSTPFSTRHLIKIADLYRIFRDIPKAIYLACMEQLLPQEMAVYNEFLVSQFAKDVIVEYTQSEVDYF
jgi:MoxR-like ATPase